MNKLLIGIMIVVIGGVAGWYFFRGDAKGPGMQIGTQQETPVTGSTGSDVTISEETTGTAGTQKGGIMGETVVTYTDTGYQPGVITVKKGTTVTFTNVSSGGMWTASAANPTHQILPGFDQLKSVAAGGTYEYTFTKIGTWQYYNHVKATDTGTVVVTE